MTVPYISKIGDGLCHFKHKYTTSELWEEFHQGPYGLGNVQRCHSTINVFLGDINELHIGRGRSEGFVVWK